MPPAPLANSSNAMASSLNSANLNYFFDENTGYYYQNNMMQPPYYKYILIINMKILNYFLNLWNFNIIIFFFFFEKFCNFCIFHIFLKKNKKNIVTIIHTIITTIWCTTQNNTLKILSAKHCITQQHSTRGPIMINLVGFIPVSTKITTSIILPHKFIIRWKHPICIKVDKFY